MEVEEGRGEGEIPCATYILQFLGVELFFAHEGEEFSGVCVLTILKLLSNFVHFRSE